MKSTNRIPAALFIILALFVSIFLSFQPELLQPSGYPLTGDGMLIARTLLVISTLFFITKLGYFLLRSK
ncbi:hypothetical protein PJ311_12350 [Bacillus sp. CLL-7-23]|uniref:Uncharacterized protein n=1 Tax=Bacillus changyiensis TaxID=3004103 RepID=A0ABT4X505_9BACI|nr:hypothetical protein [Bacillus changyiensis]MDA7027379.1 hypothetical protein [Bacillus changyiensis]